MTFKVKIVTASGNLWLSHDMFLGLEDLTKEESKASLFNKELSIEDVHTFLKAGYFSITPLFVINYEEKDESWLDLELLPDGCVPIEVISKQGQIYKTCSCNVHWNRHKELPVMFRLCNE